MGDEIGDEDDQADWNDEKSPAKLKSQIASLEEEMRRTNEYETKLINKLAKLEADLSSNRERVESLNRTLDLEKNKDAEDEKAREKERENKAKQREERILESLTEVLYTKPSSKSTSRKTFQMDTVLISFAKPTDTVRYILKFRIDESTTIEKLRKDCCKYWDVRTEEYVLKTMANSKCQNQIKVKDCFKQGEIAQLRLVMRDRFNTEVTEAERKAIVPRGKNSKNRPLQLNQDGFDGIQKRDNDHKNELRKLGGVYFLLKLRETKPSEHVEKLKLRDAIAYLTLAILIFVTYSYRADVGHSFFVTAGIKQALVRPIYVPEKDAYVPQFDQIKTIDEVWDWLNYGVADTLWDTSRMALGNYNDLIGYLNVRIKNVRAPDNETSLNRDCDDIPEDILVDLNATCYAAHIDDETEDRSTLTGVANYWSTIQSQPNNIRGPAQPYTWRSAEYNFENHNVHRVYGRVQSYDAAGYSVNYAMVKPQFGTEFKEDLVALKNLEWINLRTRLVLTDFLVYNQQYDLWANCRFILEVLPGGIVLPSHFIRTLRPNIMETRSEIAIMLAELVQVLIALYILFFVGAAERRHKILQQKASGLYYLSVSGICDVLIVTLTFTFMIWRSINFIFDMSSEDFLNKVTDALDDNNTGFYDVTRLGYLHRWIAIVQGILFLVVMYRLTTLARISRHVYMMWHMIGYATPHILFFLGIQAPTLLVFAMLTFKVYGPYIEDFATLNHAVLKSQKLITDGSSIGGMVASDFGWGFVVVLLSYIVFRFLLFNAFSAIIVEANYTVQLAQFRMGKPWSAKEWRKWIVPSLCRAIFREIWDDGGGENQATS